MTDVIQTSQVSIPSVALSQMAFGLACQRMYQDASMTRCIYLQRRGKCSSPSANAEYYRIIDRLSRGERP